VKFSFDLPTGSRPHMAQSGSQPPSRNMSAKRQKPDQLDGGGSGQQLTHKGQRDRPQKALHRWRLEPTRENKALVCAGPSYGTRSETGELFKGRPELLVVAILKGIWAVVLERKTAPISVLQCLA